MNFIVSSYWDFWNCFSTMLNPRGLQCLSILVKCSKRRLVSEQSYNCFYVIKYLIDQGHYIITHHFISCSTLTIRLYWNLLHNRLSANPTKWSNTLRQFVWFCLRIVWMFGHFVGLVLKGIVFSILKVYLGTCQTFGWGFL